MSVTGSLRAPRHDVHRADGRTRLAEHHARVQADGREHVRITHGEQRRESRTGGHAREIDALRIQIVLLDHRVHQRDDGRSFATAGATGIVIPAPTAMRVIVLRLLRIQHRESVSIGKQIDARALREFVGVLLATVQHDHERNRLGPGFRRQIERVRHVIDEAAARRRGRMIRARPLPARPRRRARTHTRFARHGTRAGAGAVAAFADAPDFSFDLTVFARAGLAAARAWVCGSLRLGRRPGVSSRATRAW